VKWFYELLYGHFRAPWDIGPRTELVQAVSSGRIQTGRAIDLGSGTASNAIFLAQHGFEVTGVDFAQAAVELGVTRAQAAGVKVNFVRDDLTRLSHAYGTFDFLVDYGVLDDLTPADRDKYVLSVLPLTHPGSIFMLYCFEWDPRWWERLLKRLFGVTMGALEPGEAERRFRPYFDIERTAGPVDYSHFIAGEAVYWMVRKKSQA
jgi:SAM-dependent methyltransferase